MNENKILVEFEVNLLEYQIYFPEDISIVPVSIKVEVSLEDIFNSMNSGDNIYSLLEEIIESESLIDGGVDSVDDYKITGIRYKNR